MSGTRVNNLTRFLLILSTAVLMLPIYGTWLDFRFAEWQPTHKHIYFGRIDLNHHRASDSKDVVNLPDQDATGQAFVLIIMPGEEMAGGAADYRHLSFGLADDYIVPDDHFLPPPKHPPRS